jgi:hypothetical protein
MNKIAFFNDTSKPIRIHPATQTHGTVCDMSPIQPLTVREFELPEGTYAWIKQWDNGTILVSPTRDRGWVKIDKKYVKIKDEN